ncbi:MAG: hypothetical protein ACJ8AD_02880 [Gemmatimonadaceae bacterium]
MRAHIRELVDSIEHGRMPCQKGLGEQGRRLRVELSLIAVGTQQGAVEQEKAAQQHEKYRADEAREQAEADALVCPAPD